jgi:hypothetical protein
MLHPNECFSDADRAWDEYQQANTEYGLAIAARNDVLNNGGLPKHGINCECRLEDARNRYVDARINYLIHFPGGK